MAKLNNMQYTTLKANQTKKKLQVVTVIVANRPHRRVLPLVGHYEYMGSLIRCRERCQLHK